MLNLSLGYVMFVSIKNYICKNFVCRMCVRWRVYVSETRFCFSCEVLPVCFAHWKVGPAPVFWASQPLEPAEWLALLILKAGDVENTISSSLSSQ